METRSICHQETVEETVFRHIESEMLHKAIATLPEVQRRRLLLYYFGNMTYQEIAELEGCKHPAVMKSVKAAIEGLSLSLRRFGRGSMFFGFRSSGNTSPELPFQVVQ